MPDRAVVDDEAPGCVPPHARYPVTFQVERIFEGKPSAMGIPDPEPRAVVAISEDRQWLVVLEPDSAPVCSYFTIFHYGRATETHPWAFQDEITDTGQSAEDVLREFLEERNG